MNRIISMSRAVQLGRQLRDIEGMIDAMTPPTRSRLAGLVMREIGEAAGCQFPHLYGTPPELRYKLWGTGTDTGVERSKSENLHVRLHGIALWLAVSYHETRESPSKELQNLHRRVQAVVRQLKAAAPASSQGGAAA